MVRKVLEVEKILGCQPKRSEARAGDVIGGIVEQLNSRMRPELEQFRYLGSESRLRF